MVVTDRLTGMEQKQAQLIADVQGLTGILAEYKNLDGMLRSLNTQIDDQEYHTDAGIDALIRSICHDLTRAIEGAFRQRREEMTALQLERATQLNVIIGSITECRGWMERLEQDIPAPYQGVKLPELEE
jgi:hypothetical protein